MSSAVYLIGREDALQGISAAAQ